MFSKSLNKYLEDCTQVLKTSVSEDMLIEYIDFVYETKDYKDIVTRVVNDIGKRYYKVWERFSKEDYDSLTDNKLTTLYKHSFRTAFPEAWKLVNLYKKQ